LTAAWDIGSIGAGRGERGGLGGDGSIGGWATPVLGHQLRNAHICALGVFMSPSHLALALTLLLSGCVASVGVLTTDVEDYGPAPLDHESTSKSYYREVLADPASVEYIEITKPKKTWVGSRFEGSSYGYLVCVSYKTKTTKGGHVRVRDALLIRRDVVDLRIPDGDWFGRKLC
jgi:hypothetical protein